MPLYIKLFHGRDDPNEDMDGWGYDGPTLGPVKFCHVTYLQDVKFDMRQAEFEQAFPEKIAEWREAGVQNGDMEWIGWHFNLVNDLVEFQGKYYGDFSVFEKEE